MWCSLWSTAINCCTLRDVFSTIGTARGLSFPCSLLLSNWVCPSFFLSARLMNTDVVPLSAFLMLISVLFFKCLSALCSAGCRLFFGFVMCTSISCELELTLSRELSEATFCCTGGSQFDLTRKGCGSLSSRKICTIGAPGLCTVLFCSPMYALCTVL